ncbi:MAG: hypothetical protein HGB18_02760 [Candidatus Moranbacteria bacterium]|nr:hypothetical protein [Candidatus Moranbacteria bacterium]
MGEDWLAKANVLLKNAWIAILAPAAVLLSLMMLFSSLGWSIAVAALQIVFAFAGTFLVLRAEPLSASFAAGAGLNGMPSVRIPQLLTALFTKEKFPDFELKKFAEAGGEEVMKMIRLWAYVYMGIGIFGAVLTIFQLRNPVAIAIVLAALCTFGAKDIAEPGKGKWFVKIAIYAGIAELVYGLILAFAPGIPFELKARTVGIDVEFHVPSDISQRTFLPMPVEGELRFKVVGEKRLHVIRRDGGVDEYYDLKRTDRGDTSAVWNYPDSPPYVIMLNGVSETLFSDQDQIIRKKGGKIIISPGDKGAHVTFNLCEPTESQFRTGDKSIERTVVTFRLWRPWLAW